MDNRTPEVDSGRRDLLKSLVTAAVAASTGVGASSEAAAAAAVAGPRQNPPTPGGYNILFILTDQERRFRPGELPADFHLPAHERLARRGTVFENHQINSCVCTPSRSVVYTGRHIQQTRMFDNTNFPWIESMSTEIDTVGDLLRAGGYYTAYKGKWHLTKEFETVNELGSPTRIFTKEMEAYGFSDYVGIGDIIAHDRGGYLHDGIIAAMATSWLRGRGKELNAGGKPWFLAVNLVNPHDVMFIDTDRPGQPVQARDILGRVRAEPDDPLYARRWNTPLPPTYGEALDAPGRPAAHGDYMGSHDGMVGNIANEDWRWRRRHDYYVNCLRDVDRHIGALLDELKVLGLESNTIVVLTADHGDLDGAHCLHSKGATAYREQNNVPLIIAHPAHRGGGRCAAVTSHLDLAPTLVAMSGAAPETKATLAARLPGRAFAHLLAAPDGAASNAVRDGALYCYNMFAYIDATFMRRVVAMLREPDGKAKVKEAATAGTLRPDLAKRGAIRAIFDGRYRFARYFSPRQHNTPATLEDLIRLNDLELYDTMRDPLERDNLARDPRRHGDLLLAMSSKLNALVEREVGEDVGQMLPGGVDGGWVTTEAVHDV